MNEALISVFPSKARHAPIGIEYILYTHKHSFYLLYMLSNHNSNSLPAPGVAMRRLSIGMFSTTVVFESHVDALSAFTIRYAT